MGFGEEFAAVAGTFQNQTNSRIDQFLGLEQLRLKMEDFNFTQSERARAAGIRERVLKEHGHRPFVREFGGDPELIMSAMERLSGMQDTRADSARDDLLARSTFGLQRAQGRYYSGEYEVAQAQRANLEAKTKLAEESAAFMAKVREAGGAVVNAIKGTLRDLQEQHTSALGAFLRETGIDVKGSQAGAFARAYDQLVAQYSADPEVLNADQYYGRGAGARVLQDKVFKEMVKMYSSSATEAPPPAEKALFGSQAPERRLGGVAGGVRDFATWAAGPLGTAGQVLGVAGKTVGDLFVGEDVTGSNQDLLGLGFGGVLGDRAQGNALAEAISGTAAPADRRAALAQFLFQMSRTAQAPKK